MLVKILRRIRQLARFDAARVAVVVMNVRCEELGHERMDPADWRNSRAMGVSEIQAAADVRVIRPPDDLRQLFDIAQVMKRIQILHCEKNVVSARILSGFAHVFRNLIDDALRAEPRHHFPENTDFLRKRSVMPGKLSEVNHQIVRMKVRRIINAAFQVFDDLPLRCSRFRKTRGVTVVLIGFHSTGLQLASNAAGLRI